MSIKSVGALLVVCVLLLVGCMPSVTPSMPNPASVYCEEQGGRLEIRTAEDGSQAGYCLFPDGSECEEWAFLRGECAPGGEPGMPNPASVYCEEQGGKLEIRTAGDGSQAGYCIFPDGSECEEWAFLRGECAPGGEPGMPNPASVYCEEQGGKLEIRTAEDGSQAGYCLFPDGSECEEWAFLRGECVPGGIYQPLDAETCGALAAAMAQTLGVEVATEQSPFQDYIGGGFGVGCQMTATGTGLDFESFPVVAEALKAMLSEGGWEEDIQYAADGPTGTASGLRQANALCLMRVNWNPSEDAHCPADQPISACELMPEQKLYEIVLQCAQDTSAG